VLLRIPTLDTKEPQFSIRKGKRSYMKVKVAVSIIIIIVVAIVFVDLRQFLGDAKAESGEPNMIFLDKMNAGKKVIRAPELDGGTGWLNTDKPIYIKNLKGKIVLLDFWTYCCINCIHVIPDLKKLEAKYPNELVVIGVHSAKFTNEKDSDNIRQAILRYGIEHPVVNDSEFRIWRSYGVRSWPTLVLINPEGYVAGAVSGEGNYEVLDKVVTALIDEFSKQGKIDKTPLKLALEKSKEPESLLSFPGKVITNGLANSSGRLFISDSNNNRIIITDLDGNVTDVIGNGLQGTQDGSYETSQFNKPQGMSLDGDKLYIADTENHLIRQADLKAKTVKTIAGTGQQARGFGMGGNALETPISSPWDLVTVGNKIYIAMAGPHQIWVLDGDSVRPYAGSGSEGRLDGRLMESELAQPSGITTDGNRLYVADSEISAIRSVDLDAKNGKVETIVGLDLFEFGDVDGKDKEVRLQHPLGVLFHNGKLYIADTYNHKIKIIDPKEKTSQTFLGTGKPGKSDGVKPSFYEPSGLAIAGNRLFIADTNNHSIRIADIATKTVSTLAIKGLNGQAGMESGLLANVIVLPSRKIKAGVDGKITIDVKFPPSYELTEGAPLDYEIESCREFTIAESDQKKTIENPKLPINIPFKVSENEGECLIKISLTMNYCNKNKGTCTIEFIKWQIPVQIEKNEGDNRLAIEYKITPKS
jgi:DNA-binding beta-propeller fold protein YncE